ncbi:hypothetical protein KP509_30G002300 [Ceratopteris richardii]|uniref:Tf2-1-like SH3-like domain-containing protein n=1 Tax=Ceratopteris richardii TaxID=49495 RepID=A0A8T2QZC3_CERRI|nr:hypothetical protein KP509_30G002300 [Ceratopteris richardii]
MDFIIELSSSQGYSIIFMVDYFTEHTHFIVAKSPFNVKITKHEETKSSLQRSKERMSKYANQKRSPREVFKAEILVLVSSCNIKIPLNFTCKFNHRYYGQYKVAKQINPITYQLELPNNIQFHNTFHVSLLKRFKARYQVWIQSSSAARCCEHLFYVGYKFQIM